MSNNLKLIYDLLKKTSQLKTSILDSVGEVKWIPVLNYNKTEFMMGVSQSGMWVVEGKNGLHALSEPQSYVRVIVLLEQSFNDIYEKVSSVFKLSNIDLNIYDIFPFVEIIKAGLEKGSEYWVELALKWYVELPSEETQNLKPSLIKITNEKWLTKKLRDKVIKYSVSLDK